MYNKCLSILFQLRVDCDSQDKKSLKVRVVEEQDQQEHIANVEFRSIPRPIEGYLLCKLHLPIPPLRLEFPVSHTFLFEL